MCSSAAGRPATKPRCRSPDGRAGFRQADVRAPDQAARSSATANAEFGGIDVLICNAGGSPEAPAATASPRFHAKIIELNLIAPLHWRRARTR